MSEDVVKQRLGLQTFSTFELREIGWVCRAFNISRNTAVRLLHALKIPLFHIAKSSLYNQAALERVLYVLTRYGGPGFAAPGSVYKASGQYRTKRGGKPLFEVDEKLLEKTEDPLILVEMAASDGRNKSAARSLADTIKSIQAKQIKQEKEKKK